MLLTGCLRVQLFATGMFGLTGVALGAYGSHGLTGKVPADRQASFLTAAHYQIMHSGVLAAIIALRFGLLASGVKGASAPAVRALEAAFGLISLGIIGFSGMIYCKVLGGPSWVGPITPMGGMAIMAGWAAFASTAFLL